MSCCETENKDECCKSESNKDECGKEKCCCGHRKIKCFAIGAAIVAGVLLLAKLFRRKKD